MDRRALLTAAASAAALPAVPSGAAQRPAPRGFRYSLNTSTIRGQRLPLPDEVDIAARAGYHAIEPWINELDAYVKAGSSLADLRKRIEDAERRLGE